MKVYIYQPRCSYFVGGGEIVPLEHAKFLSKIGVDVTLVVVRAAYIKESDYFIKYKINNPKVRVEYLDLDSSFEKIYEVKPGMEQLRWDMESYKVGLIARSYFMKIANKIDLLVLHYATDLISVPEETNSVLHLHGYPLELNYLNKVVLNDYSNYIAVSDRVAHNWSRLLNLNENQIVVSRNGIDTNEFFPKKTNKKYNFLYIGRLIEIKGVQYIIDAVKKIIGQGIDVRFAIAGKGPYEDRLRAQVAELGLECNIIFLGFVPEEYKNELYNSVDFCVLPSYDKEGILTTLLESSACGIPVITTKGTSMDEFISDQENGILIEARSSDRLAEAILKLIQDRKLSTKLGKNARNSIVSGWGWQKRTYDLLKIYCNFQKHTQFNFSVIRNIAIDIDGTLTNDKGILSALVVKNILELQEKGVKFIMCTGRSIGSALEVLRTAFDDRIIAKFLFVTSSGANFFRVTLGSDKLSLLRLGGYEYNQDYIIKNKIVSSFLEENKERVNFKESAILVGFGGSLEAKKEVMRLSTLLEKTKIKCYADNNHVVITPKSFNKSIGLNALCKLEKINPNSIIRIGDQGGLWESDYELLRHKNSFTVGSRDSSNFSGCRLINDDKGKVVVGCAGTEYMLRSLSKFIDKINQ